MHWWDELWEQWKEEPYGLPYALAALAGSIALTLPPLLLIAIGMSLIVPVERWFAVLLVLVVWPVQWRVLVALGAVLAFTPGATLIIGGFLLSRLLGPLPGLVVIVTASVFAHRVIGKREARNQARFRALFGDVDNGPPRGP